MSEKSQLMLKQEVLELRQENTALKEAVTKLLQEIDRSKNLPALPPNPNRIVQTTEQQIIEDQIEKLQLISRVGQLTLDDCRALDLLIKNKRLLEKNAPLEPEYESLTEKTPESDLLRIAGNVEGKPFGKRDKSKTGKKDTVE